MEANFALDFRRGTMQVVPLNWKTHLIDPQRKHDLVLWGAAKALALLVKGEITGAEAKLGRMRMKKKLKA